MKTNLIETRRRHLVRAKLDSMMRRTGSHFQIVKLDDGSNLPVELATLAEQSLKAEKLTNG